MATQTITETIFIEPLQNTNNNNDINSKEASNINGKVKPVASGSAPDKEKSKSRKPISNGDTDSIGTSSSLTSSSESYSSKNCVHQFQNQVTGFVNEYSSYISKLLIFISLAGYTVYLGFAINYSVEMARALIVITAIVLFCLVYIFIRDNFGDTIYSKCYVPVFSPIENNWNTIQWYKFYYLLI